MNLKNVGAGLARLKAKLAKKVPGPVRRGWARLPGEVKKGMALGAMVPVPGAMEVGGLAGGAVWGAKRARNSVEGMVSRRTGQPYRLFSMGRYEAGKVRPVEASVKLDGVHARATAEGIYSRSGKPLDLPHVRRRLRRYFRKHPGGALEGELYRKKAALEEISGQARAGGAAARKLKLHLYPGQPGRPLPIGAVRRVKGYAVKDDAGVEKVYQRALRKGHEGVVVRGEDGAKTKKKPVEDREWPVEKAAGGRRGVLTLRGDDGRPFKVQSAAGLAAAAGDRVNVSYSGLTRTGKPRAAVARRIRNDHDFSAMTEREQKQQAQIARDRKTLLRGSLVGGAAILGTAALLGKGGKVRRFTPSYPGGSAGLPAPAPQRLASGRGDKVVKTRPVIRIKAAPVPVKPTALENSRRKFGPDGAVRRKVEAAGLREKRAWGALRPATSAGLARTSAKTRAEFLRLDGKARAVPAARPAGTVTPREELMARRGQRERARQELLALRKAKNFQTPAGRLIEFSRDRDRGDTARDVAVGAGAVGTGVAALHVARQVGKTNSVVRQVVPQFAPKEVAREAARAASARVKGSLKGYFPTFIKAGKKASKLMKKRLFQTPAARLIEFNNGQQWKEEGTGRYGGALGAAAGMSRGYFKKDASGKPDIQDIPLYHAQVLKGVYNKGKKIQRGAVRGGSLVRDAADTLRGRPRAKDAAGRLKKKEWEKGWFKDGVKSAATGAALLVGAKHLRNNPAHRAKVQGAMRKGAKWVNKRVPDLMRAFQTPARRLIHFDALAAEAGWDVRDPRGRSARVFAPGSRRRVRREKDWHEKTDNERKLWKAGLLVAGTAGLAGGVAMGRRFPKAAAKAPSKVVRGPWAKSG